MLSCKPWKTEGLDLARSDPTWSSHGSDLSALGRTSGSRARSDWIPPAHDMLVNMSSMRVWGSIPEQLLSQHGGKKIGSSKTYQQIRHVGRGDIQRVRVVCSTCVLFQIFRLRLHYCAQNAAAIARDRAFEVPAKITCNKKNGMFIWDLRITEHTSSIPSLKHIAQ